MHPIAPESLLSNLQWRYAVKKFDAGKKIPSHLWSALEQAVQLSPSSYGLSPWKFVVVNDPALRVKLRAAAWNQPQITDASHLLVFCRKTAITTADIEQYVARVSQVRAVPADSLKGLQDMMVGSISAPAFDGAAWMARQVYIALGFFLSSAAMLGIDACPMEGFLSDQFDEILGLRAQGYASVVVATAGYRAADDWLASQKKVRWPEARVIDRR